MIKREKLKKIKRLKNTEKVVKRRRYIQRNVWGLTDEELKKESFERGRLRKWNMRCGCRKCKRSKPRYKDKGLSKRMRKQGLVR